MNILNTIFEFTIVLIVLIGVYKVARIISSEYDNTNNMHDDK